jgi:hypothetical protein
VLRRFDSSASSLYLSLVMSELRSRIRVPAKKPRSWAVTLIKNRGVFLGFVEAPDQKAAALVAGKPSRSASGNASG